MRTVLLVACLVALARAAAAAELTDPVPDHPSVTMFDLAKLVVPDLVSTPDGASGHKAVAFRHIEGKDMLAPPEDPIVLGVPAIDTAVVPGRPDRVVALIDLGGSDGNSRRRRCWRSSRSIRVRSCWTWSGSATTVGRRWRPPTFPCSPPARR